LNLFEGERADFLRARLKKIQSKWDADSTDMHKTSPQKQSRLPDPVQAWRLFHFVVGAT